MPRTPRDRKHYVRAYHRASAALRERHHEEWAALRAFFVAHPEDLGRDIPPGPALGRKWKPVDPTGLRERLHEFFHVGPRELWTCEDSDVPCPIFITVDQLIALIGEWLTDGAPGYEAPKAAAATARRTASR